MCVIVPSRCLDRGHFERAQFVTQYPHTDSGCDLSYCTESQNRDLVPPSKDYLFDLFVKELERIR